jgi:hypothetical protein
MTTRKSQDSSVTIVTGLQVRTPGRNINLYVNVCKTQSVTHPTGNLCHGIRQPAVNLTAADAKDAKRQAFTPPYIFMMWCSIKHKENLALYL